MKKRIQTFTVQILDMDHRPVKDARVILKSEHEEFMLFRESEKGYYSSEKDIPKGEYTLTVLKKPFEQDSRKVFIRGGVRNELFILRKPGTPYYYRGKVKTPFVPMDDTFALVIPEEAPPAGIEGPGKGKQAGKGKKSGKGPSESGPRLTETLERGRQVAEKYNLKIRESGENILANGIMICSFPHQTPPAKRREILKGIGSEGTVTVAPVVYLTNDNASLLTNEILVKFEDWVEEKEVREIAKQNKLKIIRKMPALGNMYHFTTGELPGYDILEVSNRLAEMENVVFAEPNLIHTVEEDAIIPTDFLFPEQWDHELMNTPDAWQFLRNININRTFGNAGVMIAVVDSGVDPNHPDFSGNVSNGNAKIFRSFDFVNMASNNNNLTSDHGTCCASAAAAMINNASAVAGTNEGAAGVAGNCRILAIRRGGSEARYADIYLWAAGFDPESGDANFPARINPGADVITSSFGFSVGSPISGTMSAVFDRLTDDGRNGRGTLLFFSAGNANSDLDVTFARPWGMYERCFSVAASTLANDGINEVKAGYSSFGSVVEFCAPSSSGGGVRLHNPTGGYGTLTATIRQTAPLQNLTINNNVNTGATQLNLSNILSAGSGVVTIDNGNNTESHFFITINDAAGNRTNRCNLVRPLINNHNNGTNVRTFAGYTPGNPQVADTLNGAANAGTNVITLNDATGFNVGQAILIEDPGNANAESSIVSALNVNQLTLGANLFNNHPNGTNVTGGAGNYRNYFGGTSHATPLCAGTAALMLSANPQLTWTQVRDIMRNTAIKINPGENNANGRWQDINGVFSNDPAYDGNPDFSEFYGYGRIDAAAAVRQAGWDIELVTANLNFNDVPEGRESARAVRFNVRSLWTANFHMTPPGEPFATPLGTSAFIGPSPSASVVREVYLWVTFKGTNAGDTITMADGFSVTVTNPETEQEWNIPITANTIEKETAAIMLSLDQSGSMNFSSGIGSSKRIDVLRFSANILANVIQEDNGLGIVAFDHDPHDVLSLVGPLGPVSSFDPGRASIQAAIAGFTPNPGGWTSIGNGIERAKLRLDPVTGYGSKSIIVFTDGKENRPKFIEDVQDQINDRVFAIGMGKAQNIEPAALDAITKNTGGYLLLTDDLDENSVFKLAKYFLQILAGVNNEEIVVDPDGTLFAGQEHRIPFNLNEADITTDVILMLPAPHIIDLHLETPNGHLVSSHDSITMPGLSFSSGNNVSFYRLTLPLPFGPGEREGKWHAILKINEKYAREIKYHMAAHMHETGMQYTGIASHGIPYTLLVHAFSDVRMLVWLTQTHNEPGAEITLTVKLTQYGIPLMTGASVTAGVTSPTGSKSTVNLTAAGTGTGEYEAKVTAVHGGIYHFLVRASGTTIRGREFTREQVRTAAVWQGGNSPGPGTTGGRPDRPGREELCRLLSCLLGERAISRELRERLRKSGINIDGITECLKVICSETPDQRIQAEGISRLKADFEAVLKTYEEILSRHGEK